LNGSVSLLIGTKEPLLEPFFIFNSSLKTSLPANVCLPPREEGFFEPEVYVILERRAVLSYIRVFFVSQNINGFLQQPHRKRIIYEIKVASQYIEF
jgi:hypothetical protein